MSSRGRNDSPDPHGSLLGFPGVRETKGNLGGKGRRFAVVLSRFHSDITSRLAKGAVDALLEAGVATGDIELIHVPGAWELPAAAGALVARGGIDGVVALGCVIRGETAHFEYVAGQTARGLADLSRSGRVAVSFGVLTTENLDQALARSGDDAANKGREAALSAVEMANLLDDLR